jgi:rhodanese-related sulfurtransferase
MKTETKGGAVFEEWTPAELQAAFERDEVVIIDVRTPQEYAFEHIEGALLAPMATFKPRNLPTQDGKRLVFHCGSGVRSRRVSEACLEAGFERIVHLAGGFTAWKGAKLPYVAINPATGAPRRVDPTSG